MALHPRATVGRPAYDPYHHRHQLYVRAAPAFRTFGYRQVTMKALAHACGVSAPALYRYFPSKLDFALFPLSAPPDGYCGAMMTQAAAAHADPLRGLRAALESALIDMDLLVLGMRLALEARQDGPEAFATHDFEGPEASLAEIALRCVPALGDRARDLAHTILSLVVTTAATNEEFAPEILWRQAGVILRAYLLDAGVDPVRFGAVFPETIAA